MRVIGITGGIGSGKSVVSRVLRCNGFNVYDCDSEAKRLMTNDLQLREALINELGENIYLKDGNLNKQKLSQLLYTDKHVRNFINKNVHSAVRRDLKEKIDSSSDFFFIESAILATGGITSICEAIWLVRSEVNERIKRVELRDGLSKEEIQRRFLAQQEELSLLPGNKVKIIKNDIHSSLINQIFNHLCHEGNLFDYNEVAEIPELGIKEESLIY